ncbi:MAG: alcohol dehydrogenase catalytic domain-containing protein [Ferroplasma sp.]|uniref:alcohol dehydrogenase catalytic domain-containing protein n=1 Tax=Ferroplasma sp. TaxID=2591003 RepID=UPI0028152340|nr:alcohol dehydrogenase catalytic domain-containing protein [Ferroplasma sp.]WMT51666.1 MAG: alcohol dehydrogenase catalytic domain-containing protein [Ferroplasma sp.]
MNKIGIPDRHRAAFLVDFKSPLEMGYTDTAIPVGNQVLIRVSGAGICHSDVHVWEGIWYKGGSPGKLPHIQSHEISGTVAAIGDSVPERIKPGDPVLVYPWQWLEDDRYTAAGLTNVPDRPVVPGINIDGGFQEYFLVSHYRYLVDARGIEDLPALAPLSCGGLTTYRAVKKLDGKLQPDDYVAVVGLGGLGSYAVQYLRLLFPQVNIIGADIREDSIEFAEGICRMDGYINPASGDTNKAITEITRGHGFRGVIDLVGKGTLSIYSRALSKEGIYVMVGLMGTGIQESISPFFTVSMEKTITGSYVGTLSEQHEVVDLARKGLINYRKPVSSRIALENASKGLQNLEDGKALGRQVVVF